jgi:carbon monoxide dehydrogenase subunit G
MRLENSFQVAAPESQAFDLLLDVPRVIPCMPGAELVEVVDEGTWKASMKVKIGPIALVFATDVTLEEADRESSRVRLSAQARELRGRGNGQAQIESSLVASNGGTRVDTVTDLALTGAVAQYGHGMVQDVSAQLVARFAECLKGQLAAAPAGGETAPAEAPPAVPAPAKPVRGLSLAFRALGRALARFLRRPFRRR